MSLYGGENEDELEQLRQQELLQGMEQQDLGSELTPDAESGIEQRFSAPGGEINIEDYLMQKYNPEGMASARKFGSDTRLAANLGRGFNKISSALATPGQQVDNSFYDKMYSDAGIPMVEEQSAQKAGTEQKKMISDYLTKKGLLVGRQQLTAKKDEAKKVEDTNKSADELRRDYQKDSKITPEIETHYRNIEKAAAGNTAESDVSLVYGIMKMYDPTSSVREGEFATAANSGSVPTSILNIYNKATTGERLQPGQRQGFLNTAKDRLKSQYETQGDTDNYYGNIIKQRGIDPSMVLRPRAINLDAQKKQSSVGSQKINPQEIKIIGNKKFRKVPVGWEEIE